MREKKEKFVERWGVVERVEEHSCTVVVQQSSACQTCVAASYCQSGEGQRKSVRTVRPRVAPEIGQRVLIRGTLRQSIRAVWLAYLLPLLLMLPLLFFSVRFWGEAVGALLSMGLLAVYYAVLYALRERVGRHFDFFIVQWGESPSEAASECHVSKE